MKQSGTSLPKIMLMLAAVPFVASVVASTAKAESVRSFNEQKCAIAGRTFGQYSPKQNAMLNECYGHAVAKMKGDRKLYASTPDGALKVMGFNNLVYFKRGQDLTIVSGEMSLLSEVKAIALSPDFKSISVLNAYVSATGERKQNLLFFNTSQNGNVVPFAVNSDESISDAQSVSFHPSGKEVILPLVKWVNRQSKSEIASFQIATDSRSPLAEKRPKKNTLLDSKTSSLREPASVVVKERELVALDQVNGLQAYDLDKNTATPVWSLKPNDPKLSELKDLNHLLYNSAAKVLYIIDSTGKFARIGY